MYYLEISFKDADAWHVVRFQFHYQDVEGHHVMVNLDDISFRQTRKISKSSLQSDKKKIEYQLLSMKLNWLRLTQLYGRPTRGKEGFVLVL